MPTKNLSARGSMIVPSCETWFKRLAKKPSKKSVRAASRIAQILTGVDSIKSRKARAILASDRTVGRFMARL